MLVAAGVVFLAFKILLKPTAENAVAVAIKLPKRTPTELVPQISKAIRSVAKTPAESSASSSPVLLPSSNFAAPAAVVTEMDKDSVEAPTPQERSQSYSSVETLKTENIRATSAMYAAHASLRESESADPDSVSNREALQMMVAKALAGTRSKTASASR